MGYWKKHIKKELEEVLEVFHLSGWTIEDPPKYYRVKCPCGKHQRSIHLTPSNPLYGRQALSWMKSKHCHSGKGGKR